MKIIPLLAVRVACGLAVGVLPWSVVTGSAADAIPAYKSGNVKSGTVKVEADIKGAKHLFLVVTDGGNGLACDWADWVNPELVRADGSMVKLTTLKWDSATAGWGKANIGRNSSGGTLTIAGKAYDNGIGTHAPSLITYDLPAGDFVKFTAVAGPDNGGTDQNGGTDVEFMVFTEAPPAKLLDVSGGGAGGTLASRSGPEAAQEFMKTMRPAEGLEATLFAAEPMVVNPCDMDIDERGRVWVTEGANYRSTFQKWGILREGGDRIQVLEDTNGDGKADKVTTFYQDPSINAALGICVLGNKVIVSCSPNVFLLTDSDGDGKADKRDLLFTDIKGVDHDHAVHAFVFGPDGKVYFNFGNAGSQLRRPSAALRELPLHGLVPKDEMSKGELVVDLAGNRVVDESKPYRQGMVFRCDPDGSNLETLAWNFRNNYEVAVDSFGTLWQSDNDDDGNRGVRINYVMEYGNYGYRDEANNSSWGDGWKKAQAKGAKEEEKPLYHWHLYDPGVVPNLLQTGGGSPTGMLIYEGRLLPPQFRNQMIHCDAGPRTVRAYPVKPSGAGYSAEMTDILTSSDSWYRPSDVCAAPDGSIFIADWNDAGVGGHNMVERSVETMTGRIYRVAPKGSRFTVKKPDLGTVAGCVTALQSPNLATRYLAWTELHAKQGGAEAELVKLWRGNDARMRARALFLLAQLKDGGRKYIEAALKDKEADIRITGLRIAREQKLDLIPLLQPLVQDASAQVRRECAIALRHNTSPEAAKLWAQLAIQHDGKDRWYLEALGIGADGQWNQFFAAWRSAAGDKWNSPAGRDIVWRSRSKETPALLVKLIADKQTPEAERNRYFRAMDFQSGPEKDAALVELLTLQ